MARRHDVTLAAIRPLLHVPALPWRDLIIHRLMPWLSPTDGKVRGRVGPYRASFDMRVPMHREMLAGVFDTRLWRVGLRPYLRPGSVLFDVGASNGYFSLRAAAVVGESGSVHAFEPVPANVHLLHEAKACNGIDHLTIVPAAVAAQPGTLRLYAGTGPDVPSGYASLVEEEDRRTAFTVPSTSLDCYIAGKDALVPDVVKIDVEGAEPRVLAGMYRLLHEKRPVVLLEYHPGLIGAQGLGPDALVDPLHEAGYALYRVTWQGPELIPNAAAITDFTDILALPT
jgi:FkbM family methyltransferase